MAVKSTWTGRWGQGGEVMERLSCRDPHIVAWVKEAGRDRLMFNLQVWTMEL